MPDQVENILITVAGMEDREWSARLLAGSEPWITLGVSLDQCRKNCFDPEYILYIARIREKPCGMILLDERGVAGAPYIKSIAVDPGFRSMGVGAELIQFTENIFRDKSHHLFLCVSSFNTRARNLYERLGFGKVGEFKNYIMPGQSEILMYKRIR